MVKVSRYFWIPETQGKEADPKRNLRIHAVEYSEANIGAPQISPQTNFAIF